MGWVLDEGLLLDMGRLAKKILSLVKIDCLIQHVGISLGWDRALVQIRGWQRKGREKVLRLTLLTNKGRLNMTLSMGRSS